MFDLIKKEEQAEDLLTQIKRAKKMLDTMFICDYSGSMCGMIDGISFKEHMNSILKKVGASNIIGFSDRALYSTHPFENDIMLGIGTDLTNALAFFRNRYPNFDKIILISDGEPDEPKSAKAEALKIGKRIGCIYIGPKDSNGYKFLSDLSTATGGNISNADTSDPLFGGILEQNITLLLK